MGKVELLAPAGDYESLIGAVNAGADAVYFGGDKFGARAYATNFSSEEVINALRYLHINDKRGYLTVNTLVTDEELETLVEFIRPFYESGLDGVIVQDFGVLKVLREEFPNLNLHASTQMTVTGSYFACLLKDYGVSRIVPARELSLSEIKLIKAQTGLELECFIHGAMCYSYSGRCLFSSIIGERSGNRGRCAGPCRLPYGINNISDAGLTQYPLSMKDMCTISIIPSLIDAGIDSFKIEGRMKKPEYSAGVTSVYRKYIDAYYSDSSQNMSVSEDDINLLRGLYLRSSIQTGYYNKHNGRDMITPDKPSYMGSDEQIISSVRSKYLQNIKRLSVKARGEFITGRAASFTVYDDNASFTAYGDMVQTAVNQPLTKESVIRSLSKTGNTNVDIKEFDIVVSEDAFLPVKSLNELRREAIYGFENELTDRNCSLTETTGLSIDSNKSSVSDCDNRESLKKSCVVSKLEQLEAVCSFKFDRFIIDSDLLLTSAQNVTELFKKNDIESYFVALPRIYRNTDEDYLNRLKQILIDNNDYIAGFLVRSMEYKKLIDELTKNTNKNYLLISDESLYMLNKKSEEFLLDYFDETTFSFESNYKQLRRLNAVNPNMIIYGYIPMMISANCLYKTSGICKKDNGIHTTGLTDRMNNNFLTEINCIHCYNVIYNSLPLSLHNQIEKIKKINPLYVRFDFSLEKYSEVIEICDFYFDLFNDKKNDKCPLNNFTTGHLSRGVL